MNQKQREMPRKNKHKILFGVFVHCCQLKINKNLRKKSKNIQQNKNAKQFGIGYTISDGKGKFASLSIYLFYDGSHGTALRFSKN